MGFELNEVPLGQLARHIAERTRALPDVDPGPGYKGDCKMFRPADRSPEVPVCRGTNCGRGRRCHLVIIATEGAHSDLYNVLVTCSCLTKRELDRLVEGRGEVVSG